MNVYLHREDRSLPGLLSEQLVRVNIVYVFRGAVLGVLGRHERHHDPLTDHPVVPPLDQYHVVISSFW